MNADVNVTEKVARAWAEYLGARIDAEAGDARHRGHIVERVRRQERRRSFEAGYAAALAALADPEVQAGIAGVLLATDHLTADEQAAAVVEWLRGRAL